MFSKKVIKIVFQNQLLNHIKLYNTNYQFNTEKLLLKQKETVSAS